MEANSRAIGLIVFALLSVDVVKSFNVCTYASENSVQPVPGDRHAFILCVRGHPIEMACPDGQEFNPSTGNCYFPSLTKPNAAVVCDPYEDPNNPSHFPHPTDCTKFYKCEGGIPHEINCPPGLHWSVALDRCEYPGVAKCEHESSSVPPGICPPDDDPYNPTQFPHPTDCSKFIKCEGGTPHEMQCPVGQHWNTAMGYCDYPFNAQCEQKQLAIMRLNEVEAPFIFEQCKDGRNATYLLAANDCSQFVQCTMGKSLRLKCKDPMNWNDNLKICDHAVGPDCSPKAKEAQSDCAQNEIYTKSVPGAMESFVQCVNGTRLDLKCPKGQVWHSDKKFCVSPENEQPTLQAEEETNLAIANGDQPIQHPGCPLNEDPMTPTHLPYPGDCTKFYKCLRGWAYPMNCPPQLHWSIEFDRCEWPYIAKCNPNKPVQPTPKPTPEPTPVPTPQPTEKPQPNPKCPPNEDPMNPTLLPYPDNCGKFYKCAHGLAYPMDCPAGLHWSIALNRCDWPDVAKCASRLYTTQLNPCNGAESTALIPHTSDCGKYILCSNGHSFTLSCPSHLNWNNKLRTCDAPDTADCQLNKPLVLESQTGDQNCPQHDDPLRPVYLPSKDCSAYYRCSNGIAHMELCPPGAHFNNRLKRCDFPETAGCIPNPNHIPPIIRPASTIPSAIDLAIDTTHCPLKEDPRYPTLLDNPSDCSTYYTCIHGFGHLTNCQQGLHFNKHLGRCTWPEVAGCDSDLKKHPHPPPIIRPGAGLFGPESQESSEELHSQCPIFEDPNNPTLFPYSGDCSMYYRCYRGRAYPEFCPQGLHWNEARGRCDWPEFANCYQDQAVSSVSSQLPMSGRSGFDIRCPANSDQNQLVLIANPGDCNSFYRCVNGNPHMINCPPGLQWNKVNNRCDWPEDANCHAVYDPHPNDQPADDGVREEVSPNRVCPANEDPNNPTLFGYPNDCTKYFRCYEGRAYQIDCQYGLWWNEAKKRCDYPKNVNCPAYSAPLWPGNLHPNQHPAIYPSDNYGQNSYSSVGHHYLPDYSDICNYIDGTASIPDSSDCQKYILCHQNRGVLKICPNGMLFNNFKSMCDYAQNVSCKRN